MFAPIGCSPACWTEYRPCLNGLQAFACSDYQKCGFQTMFESVAVIYYVSTAIYHISLVIVSIDCSLYSVISSY